MIFPHHENEIALSEAANGCTFARYWLHNGFITVDNEKMSKSLGNFFTVRDIAKHFPYEVIRFFILNGHYRSPINFSDELMKACQNGLERIKNARKELNFYIKNVADTKMTAEEAAKEAELNGYKEQFEAAMDDDFNTADAVSAIMSWCVSPIQKSRQAHQGICRKNSGYAGSPVRCSGRCRSGRGRSIR